jgi:hypothetical protein
MIYISYIRTKNIFVLKLLDIFDIKTKDWTEKVATINNILMYKDPRGNPFKL